MWLARLFSARKEKKKKPTALLTQFFSLLEKRSMCYYYFNGGAFVSIMSNVARCSFLERRRPRVRQECAHKWSACLIRASPLTCFRKTLPLTNGPQRSLGCVAEFSVETLDFFILTCRYKEIFQIKSLIQSLDWTLIKLFHLKSTFSWAWNVCFAVGAPQLVRRLRCSPRSPDLTQGWGSDVSGHSRNHTWSTFFCRKFLLWLGMYTTRDTWKLAQQGAQVHGPVHGHPGAYALWRGGQCKCRSAGPLCPRGWLRTLCNCVAGFKSWPRHLQSTCPWTGYLSSMLFFHLWNGNHAYLIGY